MTDWPDPERPGVPLNPEDDPQWDATDAAHPAWWRGNDHGVAAVVQIINDTLDGKPPGTYGSADLTSAIRRVAAARKAALEEAAREVDCGCAERGDVLARFATDGYKPALYLCKLGYSCCALHAATIRGLAGGGDEAGDA